jgi:pseudouridylate synthase
MKGIVFSDTMNLIFNLTNGVNMNPNLSSLYQLSHDVSSALRSGASLVALESAVITHGLPHPENIQLARQMESEIRAEGVIPATTAIIDGKIRVGLNNAEIELIGDTSTYARKISRRDFAVALARGEKGGTTVAGTLIIASAIGLKVFATGGIGGVHRDAPSDISADLPELSRSPVVVVCAGAKSILNLPATLEYLETMGVPVIGYQTDEFPAFYARESGLPVTASVDNPAQAAEIARKHWEMGLKSALLVVVPPPQETALQRSDIEGIIQKALQEAEQQHIRGAAVTPFLLGRVSALSGGASLQANLALLANNARVAAQISKALHPGKNYSIA